MQVVALSHMSLAASTSRCHALEDTLDGAFGLALLYDLLVIYLAVFANPTLGKYNNLLHSVAGLPLFLTTYRL